MDLKEILDDQGIGYRQSHTHIIINECPECGGNNKLYVDKSQNLWICFKCHSLDEDLGKGGPYALLALLGFAQHEIKELIGGQELPTYSDDFDFRLMATEEEMGMEELEQKALPTHFFHLDCTPDSFENFPEAYNYIRSRKITNINLIKKYNLMYSRLQKRIIFPIYDEKNRLVGWQGRDITNRCKQDQFRCMNRECDLRYKWYFVGETEIPEVCPDCGQKIEPTEYPKTLNSSQFKKQNMLVNQQLINWEKPVVLVEGPFDSINTPNSIPLLGKFLSTYQSKILREKAKNLILYFDGDSEGSKSTKEVYRELELFVDSIKVLYCKDEDDPGKYSYQENLDKLYYGPPVSLEEWGGMKKILT